MIRYWYKYEGQKKIHFYFLVTPLHNLKRKRRLLILWSIYRAFMILRIFLYHFLSATISFNGCAEYPNLTTATLKEGNVQSINNFIQGSTKPKMYQLVATNCKTIQEIFMDKSLSWKIIHSMSQAHAKKQILYAIHFSEFLFFVSYP